MRGPLLAQGRGPARSGRSLGGWKQGAKKLVCTVVTPTLPPAPDPPGRRLQRRAGPRRCVRKSVAMGYYVIRRSSPGAACDRAISPADNSPGARGSPVSPDSSRFLPTDCTRRRLGGNVALLVGLPGIALAQYQHPPPTHIYPTL
jgi:hypothetical protein